MTESQTLKRLQTEADELAKGSGVPVDACRDSVAQRNGYKDWEHVKRVHNRKAKS